MVGATFVLGFEHLTKEIRPGLTPRRWGSVAIQPSHPPGVDHEIATGLTVQATLAGVAAREEDWALKKITRKTTWR
jgi:hypothetical protein